MARRQLGLLTFGLLAALFALVLAVPVGGVPGAVLFGVVVLLVGVWFFRFGPDGDLWSSAHEAGLNPWWVVALVLVLAAAWLAFRVGVLAAV